jgi:hypothetical protein
VPTKEQRDNVEALTGYGIPHEEICRLVINPRTGRPIDDKTLRRHFRCELETGYVKANAKVAQSLYHQATGGGDWTKAIPSCAIWWSKTRMGWKETSVNEHTGKDGGPIEHSHARQRIEFLLNRWSSELEEGQPWHTALMPTPMRRGGSALAGLAAERQQKRGGD